MGANCGTDSKFEFQAPPQQANGGGRMRPGSNGPVPDTLEDVRTFFGMQPEEFRSLILRSIEGKGENGGGSHKKALDLAIIGGGPGGAYAAYLAHKQDPTKKVALFEKSDRIGGRLMSSGHHSKVREELGGMRIFPSVMSNLVELINECELNLVPVPLTDAHNIFYYKGTKYHKADFKLNGRSPGQMAADCLDAYRAAHPEDIKKDPYECAELRELCLHKFFKKYGATDEEIEAWQIFSGYDLYPDNVAASIFVKDGNLYGASLSNEQKYVHQGFQTLVKRMLNKSTAKVYMNTKVLSVGYNSEKDLHEIVSSDKDGRPSVHEAKNVLLSLAYDQMIEMAETLGISPARKTALDHVQMLPLFKCFLQWNESDVWWKKLGYDCGKTTSDLPVRQCHYYDENDILVYNSGPNAVFWKQEFEYSPQSAARKMFEMLKEIHEMPDMPEPKWDCVLYKFWVDGSHKWKINVDIYDSMRLICHGKKDGSRLYMAGDAFSGYQGWVVGALQTVDICFEELKKTL